MLQPLVRRTWAPQGDTPILRQWQRHDRLSAIGAITLAPRRRPIGLYWTLLDHNICAEDVVNFLRQVDATAAGTGPSGGRSIARSVPRAKPLTSRDGNGSICLGDVDDNEARRFVCGIEQPSAFQADA